MNSAIWGYLRVWTIGKTNFIRNFRPRTSAIIINSLSSLAEGTRHLWDVEVVGKLDSTIFVVRHRKQSENCDQRRRVPSTRKNCDDGDAAAISGRRSRQLDNRQIELLKDLRAQKLQSEDHIVRLTDE